MSCSRENIVMTKVLIVHPDFKRLGGIEIYLLRVCPHLTVSYTCCPIARRPNEGRLIGRAARILADYGRYWTTLADPSIDIVHLNPSLEAKSFFREALFLFMARLRRKKTLVFFHGWRPSFYRWLDRSRGRLFRLLYGKADAFIVLARAFTDALRNWGIIQPIHSETTVIGDDAIAQFDLTTAVDARLRSPTWTLVFASRLMRSKGIGTAIEALGIIQKTRPQFELVVAGSGDFAEEAQALAMRLGIRYVRFLGALAENEVYALLRSAHILCFPTEHDEGLPNTIVEAMSFGLPIVTRPVGGIPDFFESGVHGYLTDSTAPEEFARLVLRIVENPEDYRAMASANHRYARSHFLASQAAARLEGIYGAIKRA